MLKSKALAVFWFRRDLRLEDNRGLLQALESGLPVLPIFIFDKKILAPLPRLDARVEFIHRAVSALDEKFRVHGSGLTVFHGEVETVWAELFKNHKIAKIYCTEDYEPQAQRRDAYVADLSRKNGAEFQLVKDQVIFAKDEVIKADGKPYQVYTPYMRKWLSQFEEKLLRPERSDKSLARLLIYAPPPIPSLDRLGFQPTGRGFPAATVSAKALAAYADTRNCLGRRGGTSHLGMHLRFGTISLRHLVAQAREHSATYLKELIWREFFMQILYHFPHSARAPFRPEYEAVPWRNNRAEFKKWCAGETGFPAVDAGMHELNETGFMHNRARMITASFLSKHLLIDWRWGERYFAEKLLDYEMASNIGNWQWVAGCGCDAAPYFRVFNPILQAKKFDPKGEYVARWVHSPVSEPIVDHEMARRRAIVTYRQALREKKVKA